MHFKNFRVFGCHIDEPAGDEKGGGAGTVTEEKKETQETSESSKPDKKTQDAIRFFDAMNDPAKAPHLVRRMASDLGLLSEEKKETKKETNETEVSLQDDIKKALGPGWEFAADSISKAVTVAVNRLVAEQTKDIRSEVSRTSMDRVSQDIDAGLERIEKEYDLSDKVQDRLNTLMEEIPARKGQKPYDYLKSLIFQASSELDEPIAKKSTAAARSARARQNANDSFGNFRNFKGGGNGNSKSSKGGTMGLDESIRAAMEEIGG